ncbi:MAG: peptidylprolyl isomerase [Candidatus Altiarchaeota archaeon]
MPAKKGDNVRIEYEGKLDDGTVFDSSDKQGSPLEFELGSGKVIPGFENAVLGMESGDEKEFTLKPSDAYGDHDPMMVQELPKSNFPDNVESGMMFMMGLDGGIQMPVTVAEVSDDTVKLDMNHPLAGKNLNFRIKVVEISS